jgi:hypothetical protein
LLGVIADLYRFAAADEIGAPAGIDHDGPAKTPDRRR